MAVGTWRNFGPRLKTENPNFPSAKGPKIERKKVTTLSGMVVRNFFTVHVLPNWTPRGGNKAGLNLWVQTKKPKKPQKVGENLGFFFKKPGF